MAKVKKTKKAVEKVVEVKQNKFNIITTDFGREDLNVFRDEVNKVIVHLNDVI